MNIKYFLKDRILNSDINIIRIIGKKCYYIFMISKICCFFRYKMYMNDEKYIIMKYRSLFHQDPDLVNPNNFNEKNNWRKLHDRKDIYTSMVDKYKIKGIIAERCGDGHTFPLLGVWNHPQDIDFKKLPNQFVLKTNHSGGIIVCRDKDKFDKQKAIKDLYYQLKRDYYPISREWPYKNVERKIIAEAYMGENITDYKNYCFNGKLIYTFVWKNQSRIDGRKPDPYLCGCYNRNWQKEDLELDYPSIDEKVDRPLCYDELVNIAEAMSAGIPFVRVDCYIINNRVYVGEMTFFPWGGFMKFKNENWNMKLGDLQKYHQIF